MKFIKAFFKHLFVSAPKPLEEGHFRASDDMNIHNIIDAIVDRINVSGLSGYYHAEVTDAGPKHFIIYRNEQIRLKIEESVLMLSRDADDEPITHELKGDINLDEIIMSLRSLAILTYIKRDRDIIKDALYPPSWFNDKERKSALNQVIKEGHKELIKRLNEQKPE